jgi:hypothetical protein
LEHGTATGWESLRRPPPEPTQHQVSQASQVSQARFAGSLAASEASTPEGGSNGFERSQHAGLSAIIQIADAPPMTQTHSPRGLRNPPLNPPRPGPPPSLPGWAVLAPTSPAPSPVAPPPAAQPPATPQPAAPPSTTPPSTTPPPPAAPTPATQPPPPISSPAASDPAHASQSQAQSPSQPPRPALSSQSLTQIPGLPLTIILTIQVVLSARLIRSNTAFNDEALYLWAGRLEWAHWLHHTPIPAFSNYFSGAPVVYPPLGAIANAVGGLTGARVLAMLLMIGATVLLHGLTRRIFDPRSANFAAALFVGLGSTQFLGAFATYDALAIFLLALATWLGVLAAGVKPVTGRLALIVTAAAILVIADAAKYAAALFDPVVLVTIACFHWHALGRRAGALAGLLATLATCAGAGAAIAIGGHSYWAGITSTTLARPRSDWPAFGILYASTGWAGIVVLLAVFGAVATTLASRSFSVRTLVWTLVAAGFLAPAEQARIGVFTSLFKHVAFGCWFAAPVAGYALTRFIQAIPAPKATRALQVALCVAGLSGLTGVLLAADHFGNWASTSPVLPALTATLRAHPGPLLVDATPPFDYYLQDVEPWQEITSIPNYSRPAMTQEIKQRHFSVIMISYAVGGGDCGNADPAIGNRQAQCLHDIDIKVVTDLLSGRGYRLIARIPYKTTSFQSAYMIWARQEPRDTGQ